MLLVGVPALLIKRVFKHRLADYGLGPPAPGRWRLALLSAALLFVISLPAFLMGARDEGMRCTYPLYRGGFQDSNEILLYELGYFPFFVAIEFIFRGFLLFGLYHAWRSRAKEGEGDLPGFGYYAILLSMLSYTAWHLGKPVPELWGTLIWGLATGDNRAGDRHRLAHHHPALAAQRRLGHVDLVVEAAATRLRLVIGRT